MCPDEMISSKCQPEMKQSLILRMENVFVLVISFAFDYIYIIIIERIVQICISFAFYHIPIGGGWVFTWSE